MIIRKHATRQHNLPDITKVSSWSAISKVPKLFEQIMYLPLLGNYKHLVGKEVGNEIPKK
jgi:hypothetical protein